MIRVSVWRGRLASQRNINLPALPHRNMTQSGKIRLIIGSLSLRSEVKLERFETGFGHFVIKAVLLSGAFGGGTALSQIGVIASSWK